MVCTLPQIIIACEGALIRNSEEEAKRTLDLIYEKRSRCFLSTKNDLILEGYRQKLERMIKDGTE